MSDPAVAPAVPPVVPPAVPSDQKRLSDFFAPDKEVKHQRAGDGVGVPSTPAERHLLATDKSDTYKGVAGEMPMGSEVGCSSSGTKGGGSGSSLSSSVATTTTSIFDEFSSLDDQDAPAAVLTAHRR